MGISRMSVFGHTRASSGMELGSVGYVDSLLF